MTTLAIMQPYFFPYIGYFQLIASVNKFVVYDDVTFIKQGWINRNKILLQGKDAFITVPLQNASSFVKIKDTEIANTGKPKWRQNMLATIEQAYKKAPFFSEFFPIVAEVLQRNDQYVGVLALASIKNVCSYLEMETEFVDSSQRYQNTDLNGPARVIDICKKESASTYINTHGGQSLYSKSEFLEAGVSLKFIQSAPINYTQFNDQFLPGLSIIDVLMFNSRAKTRELLTQYSFV